MTSAHFIVWTPPPHFPVYVSPPLLTTNTQYVTLILFMVTRASNHEQKGGLHMYSIKGTVQQKLSGVESNINQKVLLSH